MPLATDETYRLTIARDLHRYRIHMGLREMPVAVTQEQADQLATFHYLEDHIDGGLWFEGQRLRVIADAGGPEDQELTL